MSTETIETSAAGKNKINLTNAGAVIALVARESVIDTRLELLKVTPAEGVTLEDKAETLVRASGVVNQGALAALIINLTYGEGTPITGDMLTECLAKSFPGAKVGKRHGPHYMSLARKGNLAGVEGLTIPHAQRKTKEKPAVEVEPDVLLTESGVEPNSEAPITIEGLVDNNTIEVLQQMAEALGIEFRPNWKKVTLATRIHAKLNETASDMAAEVEATAQAS